MGTVTTADGTEIFYKDWGSGQPIVFSHGWPLSADDRDTQMLFFPRPEPLSKSAFNAAAQRVTTLRNGL
jgi:pimeloyl-ACP methyl ester carboxylesterase